MYLLFLNNYYYFFYLWKPEQQARLIYKKKTITAIKWRLPGECKQKRTFPSYHHRVIWYFCYNLRRYWVILHEFAIEGIKIEILIMDQSRDIQRVFRKGASLSGPWNLMSTWFFMWTQLKKNYKWENDWSSIKA